MVLCLCMDKHARERVGMCLDGAYLLYLGIGVFTEIVTWVYPGILFAVNLIFIFLREKIVSPHMDRREETQSRALDTLRSAWEIFSIYLMF